jgi:hypothetical protein
MKDAVSTGSLAADGCLLESADSEREEIVRKQLQHVTERLRVAAVAAKTRMDADPADAPDIHDVEVLITFIESDWEPLERILATIPGEKWPSGVVEILEAVADINRILRRPIQL